MTIEKEQLGLWERIIKIIENNGYWKLTKVVVFVGCSIAFIVGLKNFADTLTADMILRTKENTIEAIEEQRVAELAEHSEQLQVRVSVKPAITDILNKTLEDMDADRAFILEMHNGTNNTAGLPFIHCSMTYEQDSKANEPIDEDYQNLTLSRFDFADYLHKNDFWCGTVDDFVEIDKRIASRMKANDATYLVITTIRADTYELGYFGFTYCHGRKPKKESEIMTHLITTVQRLSKLLDNATRENGL